MGMLDEKDLQLIGVELGKVLEHNIMPQLDAIHDDIKGINGRLTKIESTMVTKSYLDDKLSDLKGDLIGYDRKLERKTDVLVDALIERRTLTTHDLERLEQARVFPRVT